MELCIELLANAIRNNELIDGIEDKVTKFIKTINLHCDDATLFLTESSVKEACIILELFSKCSGLLINKKKSYSINDTNIESPITELEDKETKLLGFIVNKKCIVKSKKIKRYNTYYT